MPKTCEARVVVSTGQAEGGPHAPEEAAPPPTVGFRVIIEDLMPSFEVTLSLVVSNQIQQAKKIPREAQIAIRERETLVCIKRPRCDINGGSETEVTVTSKQHAQRDR